jgi:hypothetical protein
MKSLRVFLFLLCLCPSILNAQALVKGEYFFDLDPGQGLGTSVSFTAADQVTSSLNISLDGIPSGFHILGLRVKNTKGIWGNSMYRYIYVYDSTRYRIPAPAVPFVNTGEYMIDTDPGQGLGTSLTFPAGSSIDQNFNFNIHPLQKGFHTLLFRVKNSAGLWSGTKSALFYVYDTARFFSPRPVPKQINYAEYLIDEDQGQGTGYPVSLTSGDNINKSFSFNIHPLARGFHILSLRAQNMEGVWSETMSTRFYVYDTTRFQLKLPQPPQITGAEYYMDEDKGQAFGVSIPVNAGNSVTVTHPISIAGMDPGFHRIGLRVKNENNNWSNTMHSLFYVYDSSFFRIPTPNLALLDSAEYFFDTDAGQGTGTKFALSPAASITQAIGIPLNGIPTGFHKLGIRIKNQHGVWSPAANKYFYIYDTVFFTLAKGTNIKGGEYFFDDDSIKTGEGIPFSLPVSESLQYALDLDVSELDTGVHTLFVRVINQDDKWSKPLKTRFTIADWITSNNSPICFGSNEGTASVQMKKGDPPFLYLWSDPKRQTSPTASKLKPGRYSVMVTDRNKFAFTDSVVIAEADSIHLEIFKNDAQCNLSNGFASVIVDGSYPPYQYEWSSGSLEPTIEELPSGNYFVTVTDNMGCSKNSFAGIDDVGGPDILVRSIKDVKCPGTADGQISIMVTGGAAPYAFKWSNGATTQDIFGLKAGPYEVTVSDTNGCSASRQFFIAEPEPLQASVSVTKADCGITNGSATVKVTGGTSPYFFAWQGGGSSSTRSNLGLGLYRVYVTDGKNCNLTVNVGVAEKNAPLAQVTGIQEATCGSMNGSIYVSAGKNDSIYSFKWSNGETSRDLTMVNPGTYSLIVTDTLDCRMLLVATIPVEKPLVNPICMVTVDTNSKANEIYWDKLNKTGIDHYNIYRESSKYGQFTLIGEVKADMSGSYIDSLSDPSVRAYRYKISVVDTCGIESDLSDYHKTIHLTMNVGLNNTVNLIWNRYEGFEVSTYNIYRRSAYSAWQLLETVSSDVNSWTDFHPVVDGSYFIETLHPVGCNPDGGKGKTLNSSRSNRASTQKSSVIGVEDAKKQASLSLYPNPSNGIFNVHLTSETYNQIVFKLLDMSGKVIDVRVEKIQAGESVFKWDIMHLPPGLYSLVCIVDDNIRVERLIIE